MKIRKIIPLVVLSTFLATSFNSKAESGVYAGGPLYKNPEYSINELKSSGFTNVISWTIHIENDGSLGLNGEFPLVTNGVYIGDNTYPDFRSNMASLKTGTTSITRTEFGLSGYGSGTYDNVRSLLNCTESHCGTGPSSILYRNFEALKNAFPSVDALNNDDEATYHLTSAVPFHIMLADLGFQTAIVPYTNQSFWQSFITQVNQARPGTVDALYLQVYAGGAFNNPCSWNLGLPVYGGLWSRDDSPSSVQSTMQNWKDNCAETVEGGFMWLYDDFDNSSEVAAYATSINNVFDDVPPNPNDVIITARASISSTENQDKAFDNNTSTKWLDNAGIPTVTNPSWIEIKYPDANIVNTLTLTSANDAIGRDPQDINLQASNDGLNWTQLSSWTGLSFASRLESKELTFSNTQLFNYYKLSTTKNKDNIDMTQIAEIGLTETTDPQPDSIDHSGTVGVVITARASKNASLDENKAFDDNNSTKWLDNGGVPTTLAPAWIQVDLPVAKTVNSIAITSSDNANRRDPQDFNLQGSNDNGITWTAVEFWTNTSWNTRVERQLFEFVNTDTYKQYRLNFTKNKGDSSMTQMAEIELIGPES